MPLTKEQEQAIVESHISQIENQQFSASVQRARAEAAGRDAEVEQIDELQAALKKELEAVVALRSS